MTQFVEFQHMWFKPERLEMAMVQRDQPLFMSPRWRVKLYLSGNDKAEAWFKTEDEANNATRQLVEQVEKIGKDAQ